MPDYLTHDELKARVERAVAEAKRRMESDGTDVALMCALQSLAEPTPATPAPTCPTCDPAAANLAAMKAVEARKGAEK